MASPPLLLLATLLATGVDAGPPADDGREEEAATLGVVATVAGDGVGPPALHGREEQLRAALAGTLPPDDELRALLDPVALDEESVRAWLAANPAPDGAARSGAGDPDAGPAPNVDVTRSLERALFTAVLARLDAKADAQQADKERQARERAEQEARAAEQAQRDALTAANAARNARLEGLFAERARIEGARAKLGAARAEMHEKAEADLASQARRRSEAEELLALARASLAGRPTSDDLFAQVLQKQAAALDAVAAAVALQQTKNPVAEILSEDLGDVAGGASDEPDVETARKDLLSAIASLKADGARYQADARGQWFTVAAGALANARLLNDSRLVLQDKLSDAQDNELTSLSPIGMSNMSVATRQLSATVSLHVTRRVRDLAQLPARLVDPIFLGGLLWALLQAGLLLLMAWFVHRRIPAWWPTVRRNLLARTTIRARVRLLENVLGIVEDIGPRAAWLGVLVWSYQVVDDVGPQPELASMLEVAVWIVTYQITALLTHRLVLRLARRRHQLGVRTKLKILRTIRAVNRYLFVTGYVLSTTADLVGTGVLYGTVRGLAGLGLAVLLFVLVQRWRTEIVESFLEGWPDTRLADAVRATRERWYGYLVALAALGIVTGHAVVVLGKDFVLGFDQSRLALAYLFRLRIERQAQRAPRTVPRVADLPEDVRAAFADTPCNEDRFRIDRFEIARQLAAQLEDPSRGPVLVHGAYGIGKTTWANQLVASLGDGIVARRWSPSGRITDEDHLVRAVGEAFDVDAKEEEALAEGLRAQERAVFIVDGCEMLFLRDLGGYGAIDALTRLMQKTWDRVSWILVAPTPTFRFLTRARQLDEHVGRTIELGRWNEEAIRDLISKRQRASGHKVSFEDLLVTGQANNAEAQIVETEEGYVRLLWSFARGNPGIAQHLWLRSLRTTADNALKVQLYDAPTPDDLEALPELDRFVLQSFLLHRALDRDEAARSCRLSPARVRSHLERSVEMGVFEPADENGRLRIHIAWWDAVHRFLERKNLL